MAANRPGRGGGWAGALAARVLAARPATALG